MDPLTLLFSQVLGASRATPSAALTPPVGTGTLALDGLSPLAQLIQTLRGGNLPIAQANTLVGQHASALPGHYNNLSMLSEQAARMQDNNGNQITGAALFNGDEKMSTAAYRLMYGVEGFFNRGERDQQGEGGKGFTPAEFQQFATYYASNSPGKAVLDYYPFLKQEGANYNKGDIENELRRVGLNDVADEFVRANENDNDVTKMHYLMIGMDEAARRGLPALDLRNTVNGQGKNVLNDLRNPDSNRAKAFAEQRANKSALLYDPSVMGSRQLLTGADANFNNLQNANNRKNAKFTLTGFQPVGTGAVPGITGVGGTPDVIQNAIPQLDLSSLVFELANQLYSTINAGGGTGTVNNSFNTGRLFTPPPQTNPNFGNFGFGGVTNAGTFGGGGLVQLPNGQTVTTLEAQMLGIPV